MQDMSRIGLNTECVYVHFVHLPLKQLSGYCESQLPPRVLSFIPRLRCLPISKVGKARKYWELTTLSVVLISTDLMALYNLNN